MSRHSGDLMTRRLITVVETGSVHRAIERMRAEGVRRLPVLGADGAPVGVLSADDVTELLAEELTGLAHVARRPSVQEKAALPPVQERPAAPSIASPVRRRRLSRIRDAARR